MDSSRVCPYCGDPATSGDHIFPAFMGGKREIPCCIGCNSRFGHTFEKVVAAIFEKVHVHLAANGLRVSVPLKRWRKAFTLNDEFYDVVFEDDELKFLLSTPAVHKDPKTNILNARYGSEAQAKAAIAGMRKRFGIDPPLHVEVTPAMMPPVDINLGWESLRVAVKMASALASLLPQFNSHELFLMLDRKTRFSGRGLTGKATFDFRRHEFIEKNKPPLAHLIHVAREQSGIYGIVQFFGTYQFYCEIGPAILLSDSAGYFATLDPITGEEIFRQMDVQHVARPVDTLPESEASQRLSEWGNLFRSAAIERGARESLVAACRPNL